MGRQTRITTAGPLAPRGQATRTHSSGRRWAASGPNKVTLTLCHDLAVLLEATTRGDPQSPLLWTCKSTRNLADELNRMGHRVSHMTVAALLHDMDYSLQANRKTREGSSHPDRNAQFEHINRQVRAFQKARSSGGVGGHEEEGTDRGFPAMRAGNGTAEDTPSKCGQKSFPDEELGRSHSRQRL